MTAHRGLGKAKAILFSALIAANAYWVPCAAADQSLVHREMVETLEAYAVHKMGRYEEAFAKWLTLAKQGNAQGILNVGNMYQAGEGVPQDAAKAINWYRKGAEQGDPHCLYQLANAVMNGIGTPADPIRALVFYEQAAEAGSTPAQALLGRNRLEEGKLEEAQNWLRRAAEGGDQASLALLKDVSPAQDKLDPETIDPQAADSMRSLLTDLDAAANSRDAGWLTRSIIEEAEIRVRLPGQPDFREISKGEYRTLWEKTFSKAERYRFNRTDSRLQQRQDGTTVIISEIREYFTHQGKTEVLVLTETLLIDVVARTQPRIKAIDLVARRES